jgi:hypothetical protein
MRVSREQAAENRERILEIASRLFRKRGFDGIGVAGQPVENLPESIVMSASDLVDAALAGLDQGEPTVPSLPDAADWKALESARLALHPNLSRSKPAARYHMATTWLPPGVRTATSPQPGPLTPRRTNHAKRNLCRP